MIQESFINTGKVLSVSKLYFLVPHSLILIDCSTVGEMGLESSPIPLSVTAEVAIASSVARLEESEGSIAPNIT